MTTYSTGNPIGSFDTRDRADNTQNLDLLVNGAAQSYPDRLGVSRKSWKGFESDFAAFLAASGFELPALDYVDGTPLVVARPTQLIDRDGILYSVKPSESFPATLTGTWTTDQTRVVVRTDQDLRQDLSNVADLAKGVSLVGRSAVTVPSIAGLASLPGVATSSYVVLSYHAGFLGGGGVFEWDSGGDRADHNGGTVISPTVPWSAIPADYLEGVGETSLATPGVFRRTGDGFTVDCFGAKAGDAAYNSAPAFQKSVDVLNYVIAEGNYFGSGDVVITQSEFRASAIGPSSLTLDAGGVSIDPFSMTSGNYLLGPSWKDINVFRIGTPGDAFILEGDWPVTKAVANFTLKDFIVQSTGRGLVINSGIIGEVVNVRPQACTDESIYAIDGNGVHFKQCRPFNGGAVVMDGMDNWSFTGGTIEKIYDTDGALQLRGTNGLCQTFKIDSVWFEDNEGIDIVLGQDGVQVNTGAIEYCRLRNDTGLPGAIEWKAANNVHARGNRYTNYPYAHLRTGTVVKSTARGEIYGTSTSWCDSPVGLGLLDEFVAVVEVDFGTINANATKLVNAPSNIFSTGTGAPVQATDSLAVTAVNDLNFLSVIWGAGVTSGGQITMRGINTTGAAIVVGVKRFRIQLFKNIP